MSLSVSVALCTYNGARFVQRQVESILGQERLPFEVVVADDGSTDRTLDIVRKVFAARSSSSVRLRVLGGEGHLGVTLNFQRAIEAASGDLIALSDQDDVWHRDRLSSAIPSFEADPTLLFQHSDARLVGAADEPLGLSLLDALGVASEERGAISDGRAFSAYIRRNLATGATVVFRRSLLEAAIPFPPLWVHDEWLAIIAAATGHVELLDQSLIDYRQHGSNQIGVKAPTLVYRVKRMLEPRGQRNTELAERARSLVLRLREIGAHPSLIELAERKALLEAVRANLPRRRLARLGTVIAEARAGSYARLASQGNLDILRDLLQSN